MSISPRRSAVATAVVFSLLQTPQVANAVEYGYLVGGDIIQSDNIGRRPSNTQSDTIFRLRGQYDLVEFNPNFDANVSLRGQYDDYVENAVFQDRGYFQGAGNLLWRVLPGRLNYTVQNVFRQTLIISSQNDTPNNTQNTNVFATGPDIILGTPATNSIEVGTRYIRNTYEVLPTNSTQYLSTIRFIHKSSPNRAYSANLEVWDINYDNKRLIDSRVFNYILQIDRANPTGNLSIGLGYSVLKREGFKDTSGPLGRITMTRQINSSNAVDLSFISQFSDAGQYFLGNAQLGRGNQVGDVAPGAILYLQTLRFGYNRNNVFGSQILTLARSEYKYKEVTPGLVFNDRTINRGTFRMSHNFSPALIGAMDLRFAQTEYVGTDRIDNDASPRVWLQNFVSLNTSLRFQYTRNVRQSTVDRNSFTENVYMITIEYNKGIINNGFAANGFAQ